MAQRLENIQFHEQQGDQNVEDNPDDASGMTVRQAGKEIRPGQRPGIGIGYIDLEL